MPLCFQWFSQLRVEERVYVLSTVDKTICSHIKSMQLKCRENKQILLNELQSLVFMLKSKTPTVRLDLTTGISQTTDDIEFRSSPRSGNARENLIVNELELLSGIRITQTFDELDTLTVTSDLVKDADKFTHLCGDIAGYNWLRIPQEVRATDKNSQRLTSEFPMWLSPSKYHSLPKWLLFFFERNINVHF